MDSNFNQSNSPVDKKQQSPANELIGGNSIPCTQQKITIKGSEQTYCTFYFSRDASPEVIEKIKKFAQIWSIELKKQDTQSSKA